MRVLLAFDKFKDAVSAREACAVAARALAGAAPAWTCDVCPLTDGGEGFADLLTRAAGARWHELTVTGPRGAPVRAGFGLARLEQIPAGARALLDWPEGKPESQVAVIEMAQASGLALLPPSQRDPWQTTTAGTGELMRAAIEAGAEVLLLGVGGSATHDLGLGALAVLGLNWLDARGQPVSGVHPACWPELARAEHPGGLTLPPVRIACDVANPLLGPQGAAAVYAPQKGLRPEDLARLEAETARVSALLCARCGRDLAWREKPGAGAAGGIAFGLMCAASARLVPGAEFVSAWFDLEARLAAADIVITGEGRFDESSLSGKGPGAVVRRALALGKPVHVFAGQAEIGSPLPGLHLHAITAPGTPLAEALPKTADNLALAVEQLAR